MLKIRMKRMGAKKNPFYRLVVSSSARRPSARAVDTLGYYDPLRDPPLLKVDVAKVDAWVAKGAHASPTVRSLVERVRASQQ